MATRYDKLPSNFLGFVQLATIRLWVRFVRTAGSSRLENAQPWMSGLAHREAIERAGDFRLLGVTGKVRRAFQTSSVTQLRYRLRPANL